MKKARYLIEFGQGVDLHGENATKAASKAILNAMSHCCMCGTTEIPAACGKKGALEILIQVGVPRHEQVDSASLYALLPDQSAQVRIEVTEGGLIAEGAYAPAYGECTHILIADAVITVWLIDFAQE